MVLSALLASGAFFLLALGPFRMLAADLRTVVLQDGRSGEELARRQLEVQRKLALVLHDEKASTVHMNARPS